MNTSSTVTWTGISVPSGKSPEPAKAPPGLVVTRAVEVKGGFVGQVVVAEEIVWESKPVKTSSKAGQLATARVVDRLKGLLS